MARATDTGIVTNSIRYLKQESQQIREGCLRLTAWIILLIVSCSWSMEISAQQPAPQNACRSLVALGQDEGFRADGALRGRGIWLHFINPLMQGIFDRFLIPGLVSSLPKTPEVLSLVEQCRREVPTFGSGSIGYRGPIELTADLKILANRTSWTPTGIHVKTVTPFLITATGTVRLGANPQYHGVGPEGIDAGPQFNFCKFSGATQFKGGALVAKIGASGTPFLVGSVYQTFSSTSEGELFLGINDSNPRCAGDNEGSLNVTVDYSSASDSPIPECGAIGNSCYENGGAKARRVARLPHGALVEYVRSYCDTPRDKNEKNCFFAWKELNGSRILNSTGISVTAEDWQQTLNQRGDAYSAAFYSFERGKLAGRVCPPNVFLNYQSMTARDRCLYYSVGSEFAFNRDTGDFETQWRALGGVTGVESTSGRGERGSWYEANLPLCAQMGMRLPTAYETNMRRPEDAPLLPERARLCNPGQQLPFTTAPIYTARMVSWLNFDAFYGWQRHQYPDGDGATPRWAEASGVPATGDRANLTASAAVWWRMTGVWRGKELRAYIVRNTDWAYNVWTWRNRDFGRTGYFTDSFAPRWDHCFPEKYYRFVDSPKNNLEEVKSKSLAFSVRCVLP